MPNAMNAKKDNYLFLMLTDAIIAIISFHENFELNLNLVFNFNLQYHLDINRKRISIYDG
jgi:hypothetical protein